jgi:hypothetical protein
MDVGMVGVVGWLLGWWKKINNGWKKIYAIKNTIVAIINYV